MTLCNCLCIDVEYLYIGMSFDFTHIYLICIFYIFRSVVVICVYSQRLNYDKTYSKEMSTFGIFPFISQVFSREHIIPVQHAHATK